MSMEQAFETFTELLAESSGLDDKKILELERYFKDAWHEGYYSEYQLTTEEMATRNISPIHSQVYDLPYPVKFKTERTIIAVVDPDRNKGIILDGNHRHNTAVKERKPSKFKVLIIHIEIPWL